MTVIDLLGNDRQIIPYRKELNEITGGMVASIVLSQALYWWRTMEREKYYKFIEPCKHQLYRTGQSWCEELGINVKQFRLAWEKLEETEIVGHKTDSNRVTWYWINEKVLKEKLDKLDRQSVKVKMLVQNKTEIERASWKVKEINQAKSEKKYITKDENGNYYDEDGNWISEKKIKGI